MPEYTGGALARLLVEIDETLKRELKVRLIREGETLKSWLTRMAEAYVGGGVLPVRTTTRRMMDPPAREPVHPQAGRIARREDDYLD